MSELERITCRSTHGTSTCVYSPTVEAHGQWGVHRGEDVDGRPVNWMVDDEEPIR